MMYETEVLGLLAATTIATGLIMVGFWGWLLGSDKYVSRDTQLRYLQPGVVLSRTVHAVGCVFVFCFVHPDGVLSINWLVPWTMVSRILYSPWTFWRINAQVDNINSWDRYVTRSIPFRTVPYRSIPRSIPRKVSKWIIFVCLLRSAGRSSS